MDQITFCFLNTTSSHRKAFSKTLTPTLHQVVRYNISLYNLGYIILYFQYFNCAFCANQIFVLNFCCCNSKIVITQPLRQSGWSNLFVLDGCVLIVILLMLLVQLKHDNYDLTTLYYLSMVS